MKIKALFSLILLFSFFNEVQSHGRLTVPKTRKTISSGGINAPVYTCDGPVFGASRTSMRCHDSKVFTTLTPLNAGTNINLQWNLQSPANHPGDCSIWLSYDENKVAPENWIKLKDFPGCLSDNGVNAPPNGNIYITLPSDLPNCEHCVLRWEWYGVHLTDDVEFYTNCADISIQNGNPLCPVPTKTTSINNIEHFGTCPFYNAYKQKWTKNQIIDRVRGPKPWSRSLDLPCNYNKK